MSKNPLVNALGASAYIALVVTIMNVVTRTLRDKPDTFFAPVVFLSLLTLSVTVMAYVFFYQPLQFFMSGKKTEGMKLFVQTVTIFCALTAVALVLLFSGMM